MASRTPHLLAVLTLLAWLPLLASSQPIAGSRYLYTLTVSIDAVPEDRESLPGSPRFSINCTANLSVEVVDVNEGYVVLNISLQGLPNCTAYQVTHGVRTEILVSPLAALRGLGFMAGERRIPLNNTPEPGDLPFYADPGALPEDGLYQGEWSGGSYSLLYDGETGMLREGSVNLSSRLDVLPFIVRNVNASISIVLVSETVPEDGGGTSYSLWAPLAVLAGGTTAFSTLYYALARRGKGPQL